MTRKKRTRKEKRKILKATTPSRKRLKRFSVLLVYDNGNGTYTLVFRDFINDLTLLLNEACPSGNCRCAGCQMVNWRIFLYGREHFDVRFVNDKTMAINLSDSETEWTSEFIEQSQIDWEIWKNFLWIDEREFKLNST